MASIIQGYEYDIFISYRQKDNKHDGWVTEFVDNLKGELESTFKEEISVYFDINPHDGLLETHDVDASLKEKLKCLIFIPIISRTYCDPKSFAWEHEFKTFVEQASRDQFGLKVKLPNGNVANRVLPVRIHELDSDDIIQCESILGGVMRGVEFIYKERGVNRPLRSDEDNPHENLNHTIYRNQMNKVANAIKDLITAIKHYNPQQEDVPKEVFRQVSSPGKSKKTKIIAATVIVLALILIAYLLIPKNNNPKEQLEKSIAVLPFINESPVDSNRYFINGIMEEVLTNLQKIKNFRVLSRTSTDQYKGLDRPTIPEIGKKLGVSYVVEGSGQKYGNTFRLRVQLIRAKGKEAHLWAKSFEKDIKETKDIFSIQNEIAESIAAELKATITNEEKQLINKTPTESLTALDFFQRGREEHINYWKDNKNRASLQKALDLYNKALKYDSTFAQAYTGLAWVYWNKHGSEEYFSKNYVDSVILLSDIALSFDKNLAEAYLIRGYFYMTRGIINKAIDEFDKVIKINPNSWEGYAGKGDMYAVDDHVKCIDNYQKAASLNHGFQLPGLLRNISYAYLEAGFIDKARYYNLEAFKLDGDSASYYYFLGNSESCQENYEKAIEFEQKGFEIDSTTLIAGNIADQLGADYMFLNKYKESLKYYKKFLAIFNSFGTFSSSDSHRVGWAYWENGYIKEAEHYFNEQLEYSNNDIELKRVWGQRLYPYYDIASIYAFRGDKEKAYKNLKFFNQRQSMPLWAVVFMKRDPLLNNIRNEPEFQQITRDVESKYQAEHERVKKWLEEQGRL